LRHSNIGSTMNIYVKSVAESQVDAMDLLGAERGKVSISVLPRMENHSSIEGLRQATIERDNCTLLRMR
jgi:hypothetical protein